MSAPYYAIPVHALTRQTLGNDQRTNPPTQAQQTEKKTTDISTQTRGDGRAHIPRRGQQNPPHFTLSQFTVPPFITPPASEPSRETTETKTTAAFVRARSPQQQNDQPPA